MSTDSTSSSSEGLPDLIPDVTTVTEVDSNLRAFIRSVLYDTMSQAHRAAITAMLAATDHMRYRKAEIFKLSLAFDNDRLALEHERAVLDQEQVKIAEAEALALGDGNREIVKLLGEVVQLDINIVDIKEDTMPLRSLQLEQFWLYYQHAEVALCQAYGVLEALVLSENGEEVREE